MAGASGAGVLRGRRAPPVKSAPRDSTGYSGIVFGFESGSLAGAVGVLLEVESVASPVTSE